MNRVGREEFTPSPLVYTSTFSISADAILDAVRRDGITSDRCGLGWSFELRRGSDPPFGLLMPRLRTAVGGGIGHAFLKLQLDPWTVTLGKRLSIDRICCTVIVDTSFEPPNNRITAPDRQTFNKTIWLSLSSLVSTVGEFSYPMSPSSSYIVTIKVTVGLLTDAVATTSESLKHALSDSILSGDLLNIKFYLYSKHCGNRGANYPRPLFSSSHILRKLGDLDVFFASEGFKGSEDVAIDLYHLAPDDLETAMYEYDSDSDLEDEECLEKEQERQAIEGSQDDPVDLRNELEQLQTGSNVDFLRTGRVIFMKDIAFRTWNVFINYVYFDEIKFSKLQSTYPDASQLKASTRFADQKKCSPKSMYRLADKFGLNNLKKLALDNIKSQLTLKNIFTEVYSRFTSKYPDVLDAEVAFLLKNCSNTLIQSSINSALDKFGSPGDQHLRYALQKIVAGLSKSSSGRKSHS